MTGQRPTWRVYLPEWLAVYTSDQLEVPGQDECRSIFAARHAGRVREEDWRIRSAGPLRPSSQMLQLRLPNLKGEFKDYDDAVKLGGELMDRVFSGEPVAVVVLQRGSAEERGLLEYGKKLLPGAR